MDLEQRAIGLTDVPSGVIFHLMNLPDNEPSIFVKLGTTGTGVNICMGLGHPKVYFLPDGCTVVLLAIMTPEMEKWVQRLAITVKKAGVGDKPSYDDVMVADRVQRQLDSLRRTD